MPFLTTPLSSRRAFLKQSVSFAGTALLYSAMHGDEAAAQDGKAHWVWLSDTHIPADVENEYRGFKPYENLKKIVPEIAAAKPEGILINGDLARLEGLKGDYENFRELLQPLLDTCPVCMSLGNHDDRRNFLNEFTAHPAEVQNVNGKHVIAVDTGPVMLLVLDSLLYVNETAGLLGKAQRGWLSGFLEAHPEKPVILAFHHNPGDSDGVLLDTDRLFSICAPHRQVKAFVFGHSHVYEYEEQDGIHLINLPAVGYNFNDRQPVGWLEVDLSSDGGVFTLHAFGGNVADDGKSVELAWRA